MIEKSIIITGGGTGVRMGAAVPKQFLLLGGKPILMHTLHQFYTFDSNCQLIVVLPANQFTYWENLCHEFDFNIKHVVVEGGKERFHSVQNGLKVATGKLIAVHDAVRPLVAMGVIKTCFEMAENKGAAIPVLALKESVRQITENGSTAADRTRFKLVQTPQCFQANLLKKAYKKAFSAAFTDDATVVETDGVTIHLVDGNEENIKITTPTDLKIAEALMTIENE